jgi:hypothetical protein
MEITFWDVLKEMSDSDNQALRLAPIDQVTYLQKVKAGTKVTIGVAGDVVGAIAEGKFIGGFLMVDRKEYEKVLAKLKAENDPRNDSYAETDKPMSEH